MIARRGRHSTTLLSFVFALAVTAVIPPALAASAQPGPAAPQSLTPTSIDVTVNPASADTDTVFHVVAHVRPVPTSGKVRLTDWTAETGGMPLFDHQFNVNANGNASIPGGINLDPGEHWWQAEYLGDANFADSGPSSRVLITVTSLPSSLSHVFINWGDPIRYTAQGDQGPGDIQLVVDGEVHSSCQQWSWTAPQCSAVNTLPRGSHQVVVRYVPFNPEYGPSTSTIFTYPNDPQLPPITGIVVDRDVFSTNDLDVTVYAAGSDGGKSVTDVLLSNTDTLGGDGLLTDGVDLAYQAEIPWTLASGGDGLRTVWAQFHLADDTWTAPFSDSIHLDTAPPSGSFVINGGDATVGDPWSGGLEEVHLTGSVDDDLLADGGGIAYVAISNNGTLWATFPYDSDPSSFDIQWATWAGWGGTFPDGGSFTVYMKWRDTAGNWSPVATDSIRLVDASDIGYLLIDGARLASDPPLSHIADATPMVTIHVDYMPAEGIDHVLLYSEEGDPQKQVSWPAGSSELTVPWSIVDPSYGYGRGDGDKTIRAVLVSSTGRHREVAVQLVLDRVVATTSKPVPLITLDGVVAPLAGSTGMAFAQKVGTVDTTIGWSPTNNVGVASYNLQHTAGSTWTDVTLSQPKATSVVQSLSPGDTNQYRLSSTAKSGATSDWKNGPAFTIVPVDDSDGALKYSGKWHVTYPTDALGETLHSASALKASVSLHFHGRGVALVAPRSAGAGIAKVFIDGRLIKSVFLSGSYQARDVVFTISWKKRGTHTIRVVNKYAHRALTIDAFLILS